MMTGILILSIATIVAFGIGLVSRLGAMGGDARVGEAEATPAEPRAGARAARPAARHRPYRAFPAREVANGAVGGGTALLASVGAPTSLWQAALLGAAAYLGSRLAFGTDVDARTTFSGVRGFTPLDAAKALDDAHGAVARLRDERRTFAGSPVAALIDSVVERGERVLALVTEEPRRLADSERVLRVGLVGVSAETAVAADLVRRGLLEPAAPKLCRVLAETADVLHRQAEGVATAEVGSFLDDVETLHRRLQGEAGANRSIEGTRT